MRVIGLTEIRAAVYKAIEEKGADYVYPHSIDTGHCVYFEGDEQVKSCGIGWAVVELGLEEPAKDVIQRYLENRRGTAYLNEPSAETLLDELNMRDDPDVMFTSHAKRWATVFQERQDEASTWGAAALEADNRVGTSEHIGINVSGEPVTVATTTHSELFGSMHSTTKHDPTL